MLCYCTVGALHELGHVCGCFSEGLHVLKKTLHVTQSSLRTLYMNMVYFPRIQTNYQSHCHCCLYRAALKQVKCFYIPNLPVTLSGFPRSENLEMSGNAVISVSESHREFKLFFSLRVQSLENEFYPVVVNVKRCGNPVLCTWMFE